MKKILILFLFSFYGLDAQIILETDDGKKVRLFDDKTWEYVENQNDNLENDSCVSSFWKKEFFVDDFGESTSSAYVTNAKDWIIGKFNNSATSNSLLNVLLLIQNYNDNEKALAFMLYEYGSSQVKNISSNESYNVKIRDEQKNTHEFKFRLTDRVISYAKDWNKINQLLNSNSKLIFYMEPIDSYTSTNYLFTLETSCLINLVNEL